MRLLTHATVAKMYFHRKVFLFLLPFGDWMVCLCSHTGKWPIIIIMSLFVWFRSSEAKAKSPRVNNADIIRTPPQGAVNNSGGKDVKLLQTQDDSMINADSSAQRRQKPTVKRRLASFRYIDIFIHHKMIAEKKIQSKKKIKKTQLN